uniref:Uncharacterized protein n=1 Tax=Rhizophora mucronata TaxID=61149 RepID=A0A2P2NAX2_RHIMU
MKRMMFVGLQYLVIEEKLLKYGGLGTF